MQCFKRVLVIGFIISFAGQLQPVRAADGPSATKDFTLTKRYLLLPIRTGESKARVSVKVDGKVVRNFDAELAPAGDVSFWAFLDTAPFAGRGTTIAVDRNGQALERIQQVDELPASVDLYDEALRPQFHFSQRVGWNNDPNGLVYYDGEWHFFFQHNPYGWAWGNMSWGHAVSPDLLHWEQLPVALHNNGYRDLAFSGSAAVDENNTAGWQTDDEKVIVAAFTSTGRGECLAHSNDRGRTFVEFEGNPIIRHEGRDPKLFWHEQAGHWVIALYEGTDEGPKSIDFYSSPDMKNWKFESRLPGYYECAEVFELPVDGDPQKTRWVIFGADAKYAIGDFDGRKFTPEHEGKHSLHHGNYYASQTFNNAPEGRRIQLGWAKIEMPDMPFNQAFSFPAELDLRTTGDGIRLFARPIGEIESLHKRRTELRDKALTTAAPASLAVAGDLFDISAKLNVGDAKQVGLDIGGNLVTYDVEKKELNGAPLEPVDGVISLRVLVDRPMIEVFGNDGRAVITAPRQTHGDVRQISAFAKGGRAKLIDLEAYEMKSIWKQ